MIAVLHHQDQAGKLPFAVWFEGLDAQAARKVQAAIERARCRQGRMAADEKGAPRAWTVDRSRH